MADNKQYITQTQDAGCIMISEDVIATIVAQAVHDVEGVSGLNGRVGMDIAEIIGMKNNSKGLKITIGNDSELFIECNISVFYGQSIVCVAKAVQDAVCSAVESMTGISVASVNVNVTGVARQ